MSHTEAGHDFSYRRAGSAASLYGSEDLPREAIRSAKILHVSGISQAISTSAADAVFDALAMAREAGVLLSYDTNIRLKLWPIARARAVIHEAMTNIDIALPGLDDARLLVGVEDPDAIADRYLSFGARIVALKLGSQGCLIATARAAAADPAASVEAVDATGAGDTFDGAFLAEYLLDRRTFPRRALRQYGGGAGDAGLRRCRPHATAERDPGGARRAARRRNARAGRQRNQMHGAAAPFRRGTTCKYLWRTTHDRALP